MEDHAADTELRERLGLIESMIVEGRRTSERWGWTFVLWGVVYCVATGWSTRIQNGWPWLVCVAIGLVVTGVVASSRAGHHPATLLGRAVGAVWIGAAISMTSLFVALSYSGRLTDEHVFVAVLAAMLGMANGASGLILRWKPQIACAAVWWVASVVVCFSTDRQSTIIFYALIVFCLIGFGVYTMVREAWKHRGPSHA